MISSPLSTSAASSIRSNENPALRNIISSSHLSEATGRTFMAQIAAIVSESDSSTQQKMQSKKREYSSEKKVSDDEDERCELLGRIRALSLKMLLG